MNKPDVLEELVQICKLYNIEEAIYWDLIDNIKIQILQKHYLPKSQVKELVEEIIGEDEIHYNGQKMVNDPADCMDCTNPDERFCRNQLKAKQRKSPNR